MARNTQLILMQEAYLGAVADPASGAWAFEALTADLGACRLAGFHRHRGGRRLGPIGSFDGLIAREVAASRER